MTKKQLIKEYGKTILNLTEKEIMELVKILLDVRKDDKNKISLVKDSIIRDSEGSVFYTNEEDKSFIFLEFDIKIKYPKDGCINIYTFHIYRDFDVTVNDYSGYSVQINNIAKYLETIKKMVGNEN